MPQDRVDAGIAMLIIVCSLLVLYAAVRQVRRYLKRRRVAERMRQDPSFAKVRSLRRLALASFAFHAQRSSMQMVGIALDPIGPESKSLSNMGRSRVLAPKGKSDEQLEVCLRLLLCISLTLLLCYFRRSGVRR